MADGALVTPFSVPTVARTLRLAGTPLDRALALGQALEQRLVATHDAGQRDVAVPLEDVLRHAGELLAEAGEVETLRRVQVRWWVRRQRVPFVVTVGGASGTGKSTVSAAAAKALGIDNVLSTDMVRAVLRVTVHPQLVPALSESSFSAQRMFRSNLEGNRLLAAFEQQASIVSQASLGLIRRTLKEGQQTMLNGVHVVPGLVDVPPEWAVFGYVITVVDEAEHARRFQQRFATFQRDASHALARMAAIRELDEYIVAHSRAAGVRVIESTTFDDTVSRLVGAIAADIDARYALTPNSAPLPAGNDHVG